MSHPALPGPSVLSANIHRAAGLLWTSKGMSRVELSNVLGITKSTAGKIVSVLISSGIAEETGETSQASSMGRPREIVRIRKESGSVAGIYIRPGSINLELFDLSGNNLLTRKVALTWQGNGRDTILSAIKGVVIMIRSLTRFPLAGIGIGLPGIVSADGQSIINSEPLGIQSTYAFAEAVSQATGIPCLLENDADAAARSELFKKNKASDYIFVLIDLRKSLVSDKSKTERFSTGLGIVIDRRIYAGSSGAAGEFRSVFQTIPRNHQFSMDDKAFALAGTDESVRHDIAEELSANVALVANVLDLEEVVIHCQPNIWNNQFLLSMSKACQRLKAYPESRSCSVRVASSLEPVADGAAFRVFGDLFPLDDRWDSFPVWRKANAIS